MLSGDLEGSIEKIRWGEDLLFDIKRGKMSKKWTLGTDGLSICLKNFNFYAVGTDSRVAFNLIYLLENRPKILNVNFKDFFWWEIWVIFVNYVIVKKSSKIFENSFLTNGIFEFWSEALIVFISNYFK